MSIDPKILKRMQGEDSFLQTQNRGSRRVKITKGQNWIVRFLPARMGPEEMFFARIAKHWMNKLPIVCPRNTAADYGGDPECFCPVCQITDELNDSSDQAVSKFGYNTKATPQFLTWCVVWEKEGIVQPMSEVINPYEFWHYRSTWEELKGFYVAGGRRCPNSVLDYKLGNDFSVNKGKTTRLDKLDSAPIFDADEPKYAEWIKKIEAAMKTPKVVIPTQEQLQVFAHKTQEAADRLSGGGDDAPRRGAGRRAPEPEGEDDVPYDYPADRRTAAARPAARRAPEPEQEQEPEEREEAVARRAPANEDPEPTQRRRAPVEDGDPSPRRRAPAEDPEPAPRRRAAEPEPEPEQEPEPEPAPRRAPATASAKGDPRRAAPEEEIAPRRRSAPAEIEEEPVQPRRTAPAAAPARRAAPVTAAEPEPEDPEPTSEAEPEPEEAPARPAQRPAPRAAAAAPASRTLAPTARRAQQGRAEAAASTPQEDPEEEQLPEESVDAAPPAAELEADGSAEDAPPPVARKGGQGTAVKDRLAALGRTA